MTKGGRVMNFTEWVFVLLMSLGAVAGLNAASDWQQERNKERAQKQMDMILQGDELFPMYQPVEDTPERIKKEECRASSECYKLAEALVYESRSESYMGALAVASVILNRKDHPNFPNTIQGVVNQPYQFSYLMDMHKQTRPRQADWDRAYIIAYDIKNGIVQRVTDALFYLNEKAVKRVPRWAKEYEYVATIDNHTFYRYP